MKPPSAWKATAVQFLYAVCAFRAVTTGSSDKLKGLAVFKEIRKR